MCVAFPSCPVASPILESLVPKRMTPLGATLLELRMKLSVLAIGACLAATAASAEPWIDYTPAKGAYIKTMVHVDPGRIDDYLSDVIKKTWVPSQESAKRHGVIDSYMVQVKTDPYGPGPNVALIVHYPTMATYDPDKARDMAMDQEFRAIQPKATEGAVQVERAKYRTVVADEMWNVIDYSK